MLPREMKSERPFAGNAVNFRVTMGESVLPGLMPDR